MIGGNDLDAPTIDAVADLIGRHLRRHYRAGAVAVGILPAHVGDDADPQHALFGAQQADPRQQHNAKRGHQ